MTTAACGTCIALVREDGGYGAVYEGTRAYLRRSWRVPHEYGPVRAFLIANAAWEAAFAAARVFVVNYVVKGLGQPVYVSSVVLAAVAGGYIVAAVGAGRLGDDAEQASRRGVRPRNDDVGARLIVGPLIAGAAIDLTIYRAVWPICALPVLGAIPIVARLIRVEAAIDTRAPTAA